MALLAHKKKLQVKLKQQEEMSEGLTVPDIEQLKLQNLKTRNQLDELNLEYLDLKLLAANTFQALNSNKVILSQP